MAKLGKFLIFLAILDYFIYWLLVIYFPKIMIPVSFVLAFLAVYFRKDESFLQETLDTFKLSQIGILWVRRWLLSWVLTAFLGCVFCVILIVR